MRNDWWAVAGMAIAGFLLVAFLPVFQQVVEPLPVGDSIPVFSEVRQQDASASADANDGTTLSVAERRKSDAASADLADARLGPPNGGPGWQMDMQLRTTVMMDLVQTEALFTCYGTIRPARLCNTADRAHFAALAVKHARELARSEHKLAAMEDLKGQIVPSDREISAVDRAAQVDKILTDLKESIAQSRMKAVATLQSVASYMPRSSYPEALGGQLPRQLSQLMVDLRNVDSRCT